MDIWQFILPVFWLVNAEIVHKKNISTFFDGFAWLWQIVMFITLGLLVNPHELLPIAPIGLLVGFFMIIVARPGQCISLFATIQKIYFQRKTLYFVGWITRCSAYYFCHLPLDRRY